MGVTGGVGGLNERSLLGGLLPGNCIPESDLSQRSLGAGSPFTFGDLDPGIRRLVYVLRNNGFDTTDSGDGRHKRDPSTDAYMECANDVPAIYITSTPETMVAEARRLLVLLQDFGVDFNETAEEMPRFFLDATFMASQGGKAAITLVGVDDEVLGRGRPCAS